LENNKIRQSIGSHRGKTGGDEHVARVRGETARLMIADEEDVAAMNEREEIVHPETLSA